MPGDSKIAAIRDYYDRAEEQARLDDPQGQLEFERTKEIILRHLPPPPAVVADIGGGPGRYTLWLAKLGYQVLHRDLMPLHVSQLRQAANGHPHIHSAVADARQLDLADRSADIVLLLGPLYHLDQRRDRLQALAEAQRVVRPGGPVIAAAISRWSVRMDGILRARYYEKVPAVEDVVDSAERTGILPALYEGAFYAYLHRPAQLRAELTASGLENVDVLSVEGPAFLLADLAERLADPKTRQVVFETARALERVPELLGIGTHLLATGRRPQAVVAMPPSTGITAPVT